MSRQPPGGRRSCRGSYGVAYAERKAPTPLGADGAPLPASPRWVARVEAGGGPPEVTGSPVVGERREIDQVAMVEVTFVADGPDEVLVHLNGLTDAIRTSLGPAVTRPLGATGLQHLSWWLPADGCYSYRYWCPGGPVPRDAGATRPGWLAVHEQGRVDPRNPSVMHGFRDAAESVWHGPDLQVAPWPATGDDRGWVPTAHPRIRLLPGDHRLLVLFDGDRWRAGGVGAALRAAGLTHTVAAVGTGDGDERAALLTTVDGCAPLVAEARRLTPWCTGTIVAGQSFGGLAAAALAVHRPDLVDAAVAQSPSLWFRGDPVPDPGGEGDLLADLAAGRADLRTPLVVQVGTDERGLWHGARRLSDHARGSGLLVAHREVRGGHDWAWWRHGLLEALGVLG